MALRLKTLLAGLLILGGVCFTSAAEFRGLWVDAFGAGFFNAGQVKQLAEDCRKYHFNAVVVEMRRRGDAFYHPQPPNPDPRTIITTNFDALAEIIRQCHTGTPRIEVHCWLVSHFIWAWDKPPRQPGHVFNRHPEYLTQDSIGQKRIGKGWFLDSGHPTQHPDGKAVNAQRAMGRQVGVGGRGLRASPIVAGRCMANSMAAAYAKAPDRPY